MGLSSLVKNLAIKYKHTLAGFLFAQEDYSTWAETYKRILKDKKNYPIEVTYLRTYYLEFGNSDEMIFLYIKDWAKTPVEFAVLSVMVGKLVTIARLSGVMQLIELLQTLDDIPDDIQEFIDDHIAFETASIQTKLDEYGDEVETASLTDSEIDKLNDEQLNTYISLQINKDKDNEPT